MSPLVLMCFTPGYALFSAGWLSSDLVMLGSGLTLLGWQLASPEWLRRPIIERLDAQLNKRDRILAYVQRRRKRHEVLERWLTRLAQAVIAWICFALILWAVVFVAHPAQLHPVGRMILVTALVVLSIVGLAGAWWLLWAWVERRGLRRVPRLYVEVTVTAREVADRLNGGWSPIIGWMLVSLGAVCIAIAPHVQVTLFAL